MRSQEEITQIAASWLRRRYPDQVGVEFVDAADPEVARRYAELLREVEQRRWLLPAVTIDDELVPLEWFSSWGLVDAVEDWLASRARAEAQAGG